MSAGTEDDEEVCWCAGGAGVGCGGAAAGLERGEDEEDAELGGEGG